ncbi:MAG: hypothetical protein IPJ30_25630 [Acidobacteria bacterium]|nr:hypothetical protein [Acidobacteriota bacterium]
MRLEHHFGQRQCRKRHAEHLRRDDRPDSLVATPTTTGGSVVGINSSSLGTVLIANNTFGAFRSSSPTATVAGGVFGITISGSAASMTITGNTIGNSTAENMRAGINGTTTGASFASGINQASRSIPAISNYSNNTIQNFSSYGTSTSGFVRGIQTGTTSSATATATISNNIINNLITSGAVSSISSANAAAQGIQFPAGHHRRSRATGSRTSRRSTPVPLRRSSRASRTVRRRTPSSRTT